jgi:hypothetical protein
MSVIPRRFQLVLPESSVITDAVRAIISREENVNDRKMIAKNNAFRHGSSLAGTGVAGASVDLN